MQALWALGARDDGTNAGEREPRLDISIAHGLSGKSRTETRAQLERPEVGSGSSISCVQSYYSAGEPPSLLESHSRCGMQSIWPVAPHIRRRGIFQSSIRGAVPARESPHTPPPRRCSWDGRRPDSEIVAG